ncbi:MAG: cysteine hydrolase [Candidatus Fournierella pullistercoris]|uniref:Cysteine hydrolase n=1 Tax=Candidatus Allofournierella pullistercoris TaxID=2838597 RepID=A0A948T103_9FIRM|nr:cysteine hydrolase [Candidatus Fournierella pullistercoris]
MANVLVVVDYQNDFVDGSLGFERAVALEPGIAQRVEKALSDGWKVMFTRDTHPADYLTTREGQFLPVVHCVKGTPGWQLFASLHQYEQTSNPQVAIVDKPTFGSPLVAQAVQELCGGEPEQIEICGLVSNICVVSTAIMLHSTFLNSSISILEQLCAAPNPQDHDNTMKLLAGMGYHII